MVFSPPAGLAGSGGRIGSVSNAADVGSRFGEYRYCMYVPGLGNAAATALSAASCTSSVRSSSISCSLASSRMPSRSRNARKRVMGSRSTSSLRSASGR